MSKLRSNIKEGPKGYLSEEHKRKFTITAGILGAIFFIVQFLLPFILIFAIMPGVMFSQDSWMKEANPQRGALWDNKIWYVERSISRKTPDHGQTTLKYLNIGDKGGPESVGALSVDNPWLLAGNDRLWIISSSLVGFYQNGNISVISKEKKLGDISRPFFYDSFPAVIEDRPNSFALMVLDEGTWKQKLLFTLQLKEKLSCICDNLQIVPKDGKLYFFIQFGETLYFHEGLPTAAADNQRVWQPISEVYRGWSAVLLDGEPTAFLSQKPDYPAKVVGLRLKGTAWETFFSYNTGLTREIGIYPLAQSGRFAMLLQSFPGSLRLVQIDGTTIVKELRYGKGFPFPNFFGVMMLGLYGPTLLLPLILAIILTGLMKKHRVADYESESGKMPFGSLTRRALSQIIDFFVLGVPAIAGAIFIYPIFDMEKMINSERMLSAVGFMLGELLWVLASLFVFSFLEGRWGATPGKWIVGIRVVGTDLQPCGFGRAIVRNVLKFVDGFFNYLVGILLVALNENRQRVGDMAANTIVIDTRKKKTSVLK